MTVATLATATSAENRKAVIAGTIGNVLEWYDFGVYGYFATTISQLFFPGDDKTVSLLKAFAVFGVGFVMRPVGKDGAVSSAPGNRSASARAFCLVP
jgi:MHS family proline/betaine transporter-like MFS transporter